MRARKLTGFKRYLPILDWLPLYDRSQFKGDLAAGVTVGVMLIPQGMAYSIIAGLPPIYGLYASLIPLILYAIFGTSRQLAVGPVAMVSLLVAAGVSNLAQVGSNEFIGYAIVLALMVGIIQFTLGAFRLGFIVNFLSHPVISGFTSAAALIIGFSQLGHLLGFEIDRSHYIHEIIIDAFTSIGQTHIPTLLIGIGGIALILIIKKVKRALPGPLIAVVFGILVVWGFGLFDQGVKIVKEVPSGLPGLFIPSMDLASIKTLLPIALTISLIGFMESIAIAKAIQAKHKNYKLDANQELIGLGISNIGGSFFQSFPTTGGFSRTAVNDQAGAQTGIASIISAVLIGLTLLFLTPLFYYLPKAILASVIMVAVFGLIDIKEAKYLWRTNKPDLLMLIATFIGTLALGIEQGILIGVVLSLVMVIYRSTKPHFAYLGQLPGTTYYRNRGRYPEVIERPDVVVIRFDAQLYFANINFFMDTIHESVDEKGENLKLVIINASGINAVDSSAIHALHDLADELSVQGIDLYFTNVQGPVRDCFFRCGFTEKLGDKHFHLHVHDAVVNFDREHLENHLTDQHALQTNIKKQPSKEQI